MELQVNMKASAKEVFDELQRALLRDIKTSTGKNVSLEKLDKDYSYEKKLNNYLGNSVDVTVNIDKLNYPIEYSATISNSKGSNTVQYILNENEDSVDIKYIENYKAKSLLGKINYSIMSLVFTRSNKKRIKKQFLYLENQIMSKNNK